MKRIVIAGAAGAVVLFVWSLLSTTVIPWHRIGKMPSETAIAQSFRTAQVERGVYWIPGKDHSIDTGALTGHEADALAAAWKSAYKKGPIALVVYQPKGGSPLGIMRYVGALVLDFFVAVTAAILLTMAAPSLPGLPGRLGFVMLLGIFTVFGSTFMDWTWMNYPMKFTLGIAGETMVGAVLLGLTLAFLVSSDWELEEEED